MSLREKSFLCTVKILWFIRSNNFKSEMRCFLDHQEHGDGANGAKCRSSQPGGCAVTQQAVHEDCTTRWLCGDTTSRSRGLPETWWSVHLALSLNFFFDNCTFQNLLLLSVCLMLHIPPPPPRSLSLDKQWKTKNGEARILRKGLWLFIWSYFLRTGI